MTAVDRLLKRIPPSKLDPMLERLADRLDQLAQTGQGAELELHIRVVRGRFFEARWDPDERIG